MNILVTGDSGFIGTYLSKQLIENGFSVFGLDINPEKKYSVRYNFLVGNILDEEVVNRSMENIDCVIHLAAEHKDFGITKEQYFLVNERGMEVLLRCASKNNIKKFIFYSSVAVYGDNQPSTEATEPNPNNYYGASKLAAEKVLKNWYNEDTSREIVVIRPAVVFGPLNRANIYKLIKQVCDGSFIWVGNGSNIKSIAYVENVVGATIFQLKKMQSGFEIFNYADTPHYTTRELVALIAKKANVNIPQMHLPYPLAIFAASFIDVIGKITKYDFPITAKRIEKFNTSTQHFAEKIKAEGFVPPITLEEGIEKTIHWIKTDKNSTIEASSE